MEITYYYLFTLLLMLAGLVESALLPYLRIAGHQPDLILVMVASWSVLRGAREGILWALIGGIVLDLFSGAPFGVFTAALVGASLIAGAGSASFFRSHALLPFIGVILATLVYYLISLVLLYLSGRAIDWPASISRVVGPALLANALLMLIVFPAIRWLHRHTSQPEVVW